MKKGLFVNISKGIVFILILTIFVNCNEEAKSPFVSALYKDPAYNCSFETEGENMNIPISEGPSSGGSFDNQKDSLEITYDINFEEANLRTLSVQIRKFYHSKEIKGFTKDTPGGWIIKELSLTEILMAFKEGYYKNMYNQNHGAARDRITMYLNRYTQIGNMGYTYYNYFMFDMTVRYNEPPDNCGYFHLYDIQILDDCAFTFKADFEGLGYADMELKNGHINAFYFNRMSDYCMFLRTNPLILY